MTTKGKFSIEIAALSSILEALGGIEEAERQKWVIETAAARLGLGRISAAAGAPAPGTPLGSNGQGATHTGNLASLEGVSPKHFIKLKQPQTDTQRVACLAYYLTHARSMESFKGRDISGLNTESAGPKINFTRALDNSVKHTGYLAEAGSGNKQITAYGEDVVKALPDQEAVKAIPKDGKVAKKAKKGKSKKG